MRADRSALYDAVRDEMLERANGMAAGTRKRLLTRRLGKRGQHDIPPALYFDSAETPPTYFGLAHDSPSDQLRCRVRSLVSDRKAVTAIEEALGTEPPPTP